MRKVSSTDYPPQANAAAVEAAVAEIASATWRLLLTLETSAPPRSSEIEAAKAKARSAQRFGSTAAERA